MHNSAVLVKDVVKGYGNNPVLKQICMKVDRGQIYGLLGSSGSGKTTLLNAIVGKKRPESGEIWVLGEQLNGPGKGAPSTEIGYMPQEIGLTSEFTVKDAIFYFGRIYQMEDSDMEIRFQHLSDLLNLPPGNRYLKNCSGGQQRRVSFAVALIHKPQLLILDEPTVGIDPLLREKIWSYLVDLTKIENVSVIITTHYVEECKQADKIGLLRGGTLLAEESPQRLLTKYNTDSLEEVFLRLSIVQEEGKLPSSSTKYSQDFFDLNNSTETAFTSISSIRSSHEDNHAKGPKPSFKIVNKKRMRALLDKNFKQFYRSFTSVAFLLLFPLLLSILLLCCYGVDVRNIPVGIVNGESTSAFCPNFSINGTAQVEPQTVECHFKNLACRFLLHLEDNPMISKVQYDNLEKARLDAIHGSVAAILYIPNNFTSSFEERLNNDIYATEEMVKFGEIKVWLDMSNFQIGYGLKRKLIKLYMDFQKALFTDCNFLPKTGDYPLNIDTIYGAKDESFQIFAMPGAIITIVFFLGAIMTSQILVSEKEEGVWDRTIIAGVTATELTLSHLLLQATLAIIQIVEFIEIVYIIGKLKYIGSIMLVHGIAYIDAICGMSYGLFVSIVCTNQTMTNFAVMGFILPLLVISGFMWPVEGMPAGLQIISKLMPCTLPTEAFHNVVRRGMSMDDWKVAVGVVTSFVWIIIFLSISIFCLKRQR